MTLKSMSGNFKHSENLMKILMYLKEHWLKKRFIFLKGILQLRNDCHLTPKKLKASTNIMAYAVLLTEAAIRRCFSQ